MSPETCLNFSSISSDMGCSCILCWTVTPAHALRAPALLHCPDFLPKCAQGCSLLGLQPIKHSGGLKDRDRGHTDTGKIKADL